MAPYEPFALNVMAHDMRFPPLTALIGGRVHPRAGERRSVAGLLLSGGKVAGFLDGDTPPPAGAQLVDLKGMVILPGLTDAHIHLEKYAHQLHLVDCETSTREDCLRRVQAYAAQAAPGAWILGHGWNQNDWDRFGTAADLDSVAPGHPVYLTAKSLHAGWANSLALRAAGLADAVSDPAGGSFQRDSRGQLTGILLEGAMSLLTRALPTPSLANVAAEMASAQARLWRMGITGVHDFDGARSFQALQVLSEKGELGLRVLKSIPVELLPQAADLGIRSGFGGDWIRLGHVKMFADGALGPQTAAMLAPYEGQEGSTGVLLLDREAILETGIRAAEAGLALAVHAIGDRANHEVLDGLASLREYESEHGLPRRRHRIEHLQLVHPDDLPRPAELEVIASMQPLHATSDMTMADRHWGQRVRTAYAWQSQRRLGAPLAFGSDAPVEPPDPWLGMHAAMTRRRLDGTPSPDGWTPQERLALEDALSGYTEGPAFAAGREDDLGRLQSGYWADLFVVEQDPYDIPPEALPGLRVRGTMVGGRWVFRDF